MIKNKSIYYLPQFGQLGNQLTIMAHLIAFAKTYNYEIIYPYSKFLNENLKSNKIMDGKFKYSKFLSFKLYSILLINLIKIITLKRDFFFGSSLIINNEFIADNQINPNQLPTRIIITSWLFRFYSGVKQHDKYLRGQLLFEEKIVNKVNIQISEIKKTFNKHTLIGIHVRRGDYIRWLNGIHYYDLNFYYLKMSELSKNFSNCLFIICSNEIVNFSNIENLKMYYTNGLAIEDLCFLSQCDYILGPPSTFSGWAAFMGNKLIHFLNNQDEQILLSSFQKNLL